MSSDTEVSPELAAKITRRKLQYTRFADTHQWDKWRGVFVPDLHARFHHPDGKVVHMNNTDYEWKDLDSFVAYFTKAFESTQVIHMIGPGEMDLVAEDEVKAIFPVIFQTGCKAIAGGLHGTGGGHYHEVWKKIDGEWYIKSIDMETLYLKFVQSEAPEGLGP